jgi:leucyl/phenylalanyl-tRNA---protein transferase
VAILDPELLLRAYSIGVFPMSDSRDAREVFWVEPKRRAILPLDAFHLSRSLRKTLRTGRFDVTRDAAFEAVVTRCAERAETWINAQIEASYLELHRLGHAHSVECWQEARLRVGGFSLLDCQFMTDHLRSLGAVEVTQKDYVVMLSSALGEGVERRGGEAPEFGALDRLLASDPSRTVDAPAAGCVIAQLLGHTS